MISRIVGGAGECEEPAFDAVTSLRHHEAIRGGVTTNPSNDMRAPASP